MTAAATAAASDPSLLFTIPPHFELLLVCSGYSSIEMVKKASFFRLLLRKPGLLLMVSVDMFLLVPSTHEHEYKCCS